MSKVYGLISGYTPVRTERNRTVVSYDKQAEPDGKHATWHELYFYHKIEGKPDIARIKEAVTADINSRTTERILSSLTWNGKPVWLSKEHQMDWKMTYDRALQTEGENLPQKLKLGEAEDGTPVYHTFTTVKAFGDFTDAWQQHIMQCLADGWEKKDGMDWAPYEPVPAEG